MSLLVKPYEIADTQPFNFSPLSNSNFMWFKLLLRRELKGMCLPIVELPGPAFNLRPIIKCEFMTWIHPLNNMYPHVIHTQPSANIGAIGHGGSGRDFPLP